MQITTAVFDKNQRKMISDAIRGRLPGFVIVAGHAAKIRDKLLKSGIDVSRVNVHQHLIRLGNNQEVFRAAYLVLQDERPAQLANLFNGTDFNQNVISIALLDECLST